MKLQDFLNMDSQDFNDLTKKENRSQAEDVIKQMSRIANNRLRNLSKLDIPSPAFSNRAVTDKEGFAARGSDGNFLYEEFQSTGDLRQIRRELKYIHSFLSSKTSTVPGARRYSEDIMKRVGGYKNLKEARENMWDYESSKQFWTVWDKLNESSYNLVQNILGSGVTQQVSREVYNRNPMMGIDEDYYRERVLDVMTEIRDISYGKYDNMTEDDWNELEERDPGRSELIQEAQRIYDEVLGGNLHPTPKI